MGCQFSMEGLWRSLDFFNPATHDTTEALG
jgi:hypothetical protein